MYGYIKGYGLHNLITTEGDFVRRTNDEYSMIPFQQHVVSGDCIVSWCLAYTDESLETKPIDALLSATKRYMKYLGTRSNGPETGTWVSDRCNNFGVNYCPDSTYKFGQPAAGPQFYTTSCLLALASQHSRFYKLVFWLHWLLMGGWLWAFSPVIFPPSKPLFYVRDMTLKALFVHKYVFGNRWWIRLPMNFIVSRINENENAMWNALVGKTKGINELPAVLDPFFSQRDDSTSRMTDRPNPFLKEALIRLAKQSAALNDK
jgi:hypothetical protein